MKNLQHLHSRKTGMTFVEVTIAIVIALMVSLILYASAIYTRKQTHKSIEHIYAIQMLNSAAAKVRTATYSKLIDFTKISNTDFEKQFTSSQVLKSDNLNPRSTTYTLTYAFSGIGKGISLISGGPDVELTLAPHSAPWKKDEYKGHLLVITSGAAINQIMYVKGNDASANGKVKVQLTRDIRNPTSSVNWDAGDAPGNTSGFCMDYGIYCTATVTWGPKEYETIPETVFVPVS